MFLLSKVVHLEHTYQYRVTREFIYFRDRTEEAKVILCKLRNRSEDDPETIDELNQIVTAVALEKQQDGSKWKELLERYNIHRLALGCFMQIAQQWTGTNAIVSFPKSIIRLIQFTDFFF